MLGDLRRFAAAAADRLFAENVLFRFGRGPKHFEMQVIGGGDAQHVDVGVRRGLPPVGRRLLEAEPFLGFASPRGQVVGADHEPRLEPLLVKAIPNGAIRPSVNETHPAHPDDADSNHLGNGLVPSSGRHIDEKPAGPATPSRGLIVTRSDGPRHVACRRQPARARAGSVVPTPFFSEGNPRYSGRGATPEALRGRANLFDF